MALNKHPFRSSKINFADRFFPARPAGLIREARKLAKDQLEAARKLGLPNSTNIGYIRWLRKESMLYNANQLSLAYSGKGSMWQNPFAKPRPRTALGMASVWYTAYPISLITKRRQTILAALGDDDLWQAFQHIGIQGIHTGPMKRAGGLSGWKETPSIDGHFDRISTHIDPVFGTEAEFRRMSETAAKYGGIVIDDIVPGHTGKGADFRLAEMGYRDYPGIYHMVEIDRADWNILPDVPDGRDSVNIDPATEEQLKKRGYIIGKLQRVIFYEPGVKETNWSVTKAVRGVDGVKRRWVYLHYFKDGQPSINWLDPSFAGMKLVIGDAIHSLGQLGSKALRLDANGFLGIEKSSEDKPAWSEGHPLSGAANQVISGMVRKVGGFTFQELNLSIDDIKTLSDNGADLSYDFVNRPAYHHALSTSDTEFLRITLRSALEIGVDPASLVHALQNHDELTLELVHFWTLHKDDEYSYHGETVSGEKLRDIVREDLQRVLTGHKASYNLPFTENGIACTTASVIAAVLGYQDVTRLEAEDIERIKRVHMLLAQFNALQPGVFALSGWDLSGSLPISPADIPELLADGDTRWINRGAYDMMNSNPEASESFAGMPKAINLYGSLPEQLADDNSFANQLRRMLAVREKYEIAVARQLDIPNVSHKSMLVMVHKLQQDENLQVTVLNFSDEPITGTVVSEFLPAGAQVIDMFTNEHLAEVDDIHSFSLSLDSYQGTSLLIRPQQ